MDQVWLWVAFNVFVLAMLAVDLLVFHKEAHEVTSAEHPEPPSPSSGGVSEAPSIVSRTRSGMGSSSPPR